MYTNDFKLIYTLFLKVRTRINNHNKNVNKLVKTYDPLRKNLYNAS